MVGTLASFLLMAVAGKELQASISTFEVLFWRSVVGLVVVLFLLWRLDWQGLRTPKPLIHVGRNAIHFVAQYGWFYGIAFIPLAEVFAIEFTTPIWTMLLAAVFLGEAITRWRVLAVVLGFVGIIIILRPGFAAVSIAQFAVLGAALGYAASYVFTKHLVGVDRPITILFYMVLLQVPLGLIFSLGQWVWPAGIDWLWVVAAGLTGLTAHYCLSRALQLADAMIVTPMDFMRLPLAALVGFVIYGQLISYWVFVGAAVIFVGLFINIRHDAKATKAP